MGCLAPILSVSRYDIYACVASGRFGANHNGTFFRPIRTRVILLRLACECAGMRPTQEGSMLRDTYLPSRIVLLVLTLRGFRGMCKPRFEFIFPSVK